MTRLRLALGALLWVPHWLRLASLLRYTMRACNCNGSCSHCWQARRALLTYDAWEVCSLLCDARYGCKARARGPCPWCDDITAAVDAFEAFCGTTTLEDR